MATLNIKNMPDALYKKLQKRARQRRRSLAQEVTQILAEAVESSRTYSILELQGLGKDAWEGVDSDKHVDGERRSWD